MTNGSFSLNLNEVSGLFTSGVSDPHIRVEVTGDTYAAFVNGSTTPATTLTTANFASGEFGLYDFSNQTFDNVVLFSPVPEPTGGVAFVGLVAITVGIIPRRIKALRTRRFIRFWLTKEEN